MAESDTPTPQKLLPDESHRAVKPGTALLRLQTTHSREGAAAHSREGAAAQQAPPRPLMVRGHLPIGSAVVRWHGDPQEADGRHHFEWTVEEDLLWGRNTWPATLPEPGLRQRPTRSSSATAFGSPKTAPRSSIWATHRFGSTSAHPSPPASTAAGWRSVSKPTKSPCIPTCSDRSGSKRSRSPVRGHRAPPHPPARFAQAQTRAAWARGHGGP